MVLLGTVFPLIVEAVNGERLSVGVPYFSRMTMPIGFALLMLMAVAPVLPWRKATGELLRERLWWPAIVGVATVVIAALLGATSPTACWRSVSVGSPPDRRSASSRSATRRQGWRGLVGRANGGMVVHLGVIMIAVAFAASSAFIRQGEFTLKESQKARDRRPHRRVPRTEDRRPGQPGGARRPDPGRR